MAYGKDKGRGALAILIPHGGSKGPPEGDSKDEGDGGDELDPGFAAAFHDFYKIEDDPKSTEEDCARAFWRAVKACVEAGDY